MRNINVKLFKIGSVVQEKMLFKGISIFSSGGQFVDRVVTIYAILVERIMWNIHVK